MKLTEFLAKSKANVFDIQNIKQLNLWGNQLTDVSLLLQIPFIEVLALGNNQISSLRALKNCHSLKQLYLLNNQIESFEELNYLKDAKSLTLLSLRGNPCALAAGDKYRISVLHMLPQLITLDDIEITDEERHKVFEEQEFRILILRIWIIKMSKSSRTRWM
ncbi:protein C21orf2 homolog [Drosophila serrata]|uniref:protein C21orf2 homolog n=1 Tax=Drosophila serrata TaxID=7274 RepID=UPI000A1CFD8F|nr:protein C21orf2 homolog [Drosophila serrata]